MGRRWVLFACVAIVTVLSASLLGGLTVHGLVRSADRLTIEGQADVVRPIPPSFGEGWSAYGGDPMGTRFSTARTINRETVGGLAVAWTYQTRALDGRTAVRDRTTFQATPILVEGKLIFCTPFNEVIALDPSNGREIWRHDPGVPLDGRPANQFTCRGVSSWRASDDGDAGPCASRILAATVDARLIALATATGRRCEDFGSDGEVRIEPDIALRWPGEFQITSAPAVIGDVVVTGTAIGDNLRTEAPKGTVFAFDVRSGDLKWRFDPIPSDPSDPAHATWQGGSSLRTGHANVWSTISADPSRNLVFLPTSSPSPDYYGGNRIGDGAYANAVVALNADTGEVVWHFQTVHHDVWDYDLPAQPGLYEVWRDGRPHDVVAQVTKTGLLFVLDRDTGEPFLPVEERAVPQGAVSGEVLSPTQPFPTSTPPIVPNRLDPDKDAFGLTLWDRAACARRLRAYRHDGLYTPPTEEGTLTYPFMGGGANWGSTAYDPTRNLLVVNMSNLAGFVRLTRKSEDGTTAERIEDGSELAPMEGAPFAMQRGMVMSPLGLPCSPPPWGILAGIDLATGEIVWRRPLGTTRDLAPGGLALPLGTPNLGGPMITASGLVFIGAAMDDYLRAFDVETGEALWKGRLPAGGQATPMTYVHEGRQYVVIAAGGHARAGTRIGDHLVAFALPE